MLETIPSAAGRCVARLEEVVAFLRSEGELISPHELAGAPQD
jgi:hypothetical protein